MTAKRTSFKLKTELAELETLRQELGRYGQAANLPPKKLFEINLVLDELFTNIISHGCLEPPEDRVSISLSYKGDQMQIEVRDGGIPFNPLDAKPPDLECALEERSVGGLGIHLVKKMVDAMEYQRSGNKNILKMRKTIPSK